MPRDYEVYCPSCGYKATRYRNIKKCPECGGDLVRMVDKADDKLVEKIAIEGQQQFGYVDWDVELPHTKGRWRELARFAKQAILSDPDITMKLEFAEKVAKVMDDLRSSHVFFVLQQAYGDMDWEETQGILNKILNLKGIEN